MPSIAYSTPTAASAFGSPQQAACAESTDAQLTAQKIATGNAHYADYRAGVIAAWGEVAK